MRAPQRSYLRPVTPWFMAILFAVFALVNEGCLPQSGQTPDSMQTPGGGQPPGSTQAPAGGHTNSRSAPGTGGKGVADKAGKGSATAAISSGELTKSDQTPAAAKPAKPEPPRPECFTMNFKHKEIAAHRDGEACLNHDNAFKLPPERINTKTLCVRVNGTPVKHRLVKGKPGVIVIGANAGPESVVTVRWCTDKTTCKEDCTVPKDEFMDAIGGMADGGGYVQWDPSEKKKGPSNDEVRLEKEMHAFGGGKREVFDQWVAQQKPKLTCGTEAGRSVANR